MMPQYQPYQQPQSKQQGTSNLRIFWIIWCSMWGLGWLFVGFVFFPFWIMVPASLLCILIPVGQGRRQVYQPQMPAMPACTNCGAPAAAHVMGRCPQQQAGPEQAAPAPDQATWPYRQRAE